MSLNDYQYIVSQFMGLIALWLRPWHPLVGVIIHIQTIGITVVGTVITSYTQLE